MSMIQTPNADFIWKLSEKTTPLRIEFVCSGLKNSDLPASTAPEIALVGRSNVGKSSLLNFLAGHNQLARVSHTPGRTQTINLFSAEKDAFFIVDLPGYGYAETPHKTRDHWEQSMRYFFEERPGLFAIFMLVDIRRDVQKEDEMLSRWLQNLGLKVIAIQTKCDKIHKSKWQGIRLTHAKNLALHPSQVITTSSDKKIGLTEIFQTVSGLLDSYDKEIKEQEQ